MTITLEPEDIRFDLLTEDEKIHFHQVYQKEINTLKELGSAFGSSDKLNEGIDRLTQEMYRDMLTLTRPRMNDLDSDGCPILSPDDFLQKLQVAQTAEERERLKQTITRPILVNQDGETRTIPIDASLAPFIKSLKDSGYKTGQSCSGILADHPGYRYVQDDSQKRYVEGECIMFNKQGSCAYLTFWKPEAALDYLRNTPEQIADIRRIAEAQGWIVEDTDIFFQPSLRLGLPLTYDGMGKRAILDEASKLTNQKFPDLYEKDFLHWLKERTPIQVEVEKAHGGVILWSDQMILKRWKMLTQALCEAQKQRQQLECETKNSILMNTSITIDPHTLSGEKETWQLRFKHYMFTPAEDRTSLTDKRNTQRVGILFEAFKEGNTPAEMMDVLIGTASFLPGHKPDVIQLTTYPDSEEFVETLLKDGRATLLGQRTERYQDYPGADEIEEFRYQTLDITDFYNQYIKDGQKKVEESPVSHITFCQGPVMNGKDPQDYIKCRIGGIEFPNRAWVGSQGRELDKVAQYYPDCRFQLHELAEQAFAEQLKLYRQAQQRVTHYSNYQTKGVHYIRCKIDGEQQLSREINRLDICDYLLDKDFFALAAKYYADKLEDGQNIKQGLSR